VTDLTVPEVAKRLGVKPSAVRKAIARGVLPAQTVSGRFSLYEYLVTDVDVETYRASHRRPRKEPAS
jgi:excisionase family DNA binding protein